MAYREGQWDTAGNPLALKLEEFILELPGAFKDYAWGGCLYKTRAGKLICAMFHDKGKLKVLSKLTKEEQAAVVDHEQTLIASHIGRHGWITYILTDSADLEQAEGYILRSFELVATKKDIALLGG